MVNNGKTPQNGFRKDWKVFTGDSEKVTVDQMNTAQYRDDLIHKIEVYQNVKSTLDLCRTMIMAIEPSTADESFNRRMLLEHLDLTRTNTLLAQIGTEHEFKGLGK